MGVSWDLLYTSGALNGRSHELQIDPLCPAGSRFYAFIPTCLSWSLLSPLAIIGDWSIGRGPGWLLGLIGAVPGTILPCMAPCCPGADAPIGGAEAELVQPSCCCCMPGRGPTGAISPGGSNDTETGSCEKTGWTDFWEFPLHPCCAGEWEIFQCKPGSCLRTIDMWETQREKLC